MLWTFPRTWPKTTTGFSCHPLRHGGSWSLLTSCGQFSVHSQTRNLPAKWSSLIIPTTFVPWSKNPRFFSLVTKRLQQVFLQNRCMTVPTTYWSIVKFALPKNRRNSTKWVDLHGEHLNMTGCKAFSKVQEELSSRRKGVTCHQRYPCQQGMSYKIKSHG